MLIKPLSKFSLKKTLFKAPIVLGGLCLSTSLLAAPVNDVKAMFVGHSLINSDMPEMVKQLAQSGSQLTMEKAVQVINGSPLRNNWEKCTSDSFTGDYPPSAFACDEINAASGADAYDTLVMTEANNPIRGQHFYNQTQEYLEKFSTLLNSKNPASRAFFFTSWEGIYYHQGPWTDEIAGEMGEFEQILAEAKRLSIINGDGQNSASIEIIPSSLALRELIIKVENGEINGLTHRKDLFVDDVHMNRIGNYFMANVVFSALYNVSPEGLTNEILNGNGSLDVAIEATLATQLQQLAWTVVSDYRAEKALPGGENGAPNSQIVVGGGTQFVHIGREMTFAATVSDPDLDTNFTYAWDFDGVAPEQTTLTTTGVTFNQQGTYKISFVVTDSEGKSDPSPAVSTIVVELPSEPDPQPIAEIASPVGEQSITVGDSLSFSGLTTDPYGDTGHTYLWDFGGIDYKQYTLDTTPVVFDRVGEFDVTFTVTNSFGYVDATPAKIKVVVTQGSEEPTGLSNIGNFSATDITEQGTSTLTWSAPSVIADIAFYNVMVNDVVVATAQSNQLTYGLTGLDINQVNAISIAGASSTGEVIAQSSVFNLAAFGSEGEFGSMTLSATPIIESYGVGLSWTPMAGAVRFYQVFRDGQFIGHTNGGSLGFNADWMALRQAYDFQIKAIGFDDDSVIGASDIVTSMAGDSIAPTVVTGLTAEFNGVTGFNLSWAASTDNSGSVQYAVYRNDVMQGNTSATTFADQWPPEGTLSYHIVAHDGSYGNRAQASQTVIAAVPSDTFTMSATARPDSWGVELSWDYVNSDVQYFQIYRDNVFIGNTNGDATSFNADWLQLQVDYSFQVRAVGVDGATLMVSQTIVMQAGDSQAPSQPTDLMVTFDGAYGFDVSWTASTDNTEVAYYKVYRNGVAYTTAYGLTLSDEWPPQGDVTYQIIAVDKYHNLSEASVIVTGSTNP